MNALPTELLRQAQQLSEEVTRPIPGSRKVHVAGSRPDLQVPMREIALSPTPRVFGVQEPNAPFTVYDTSGPYTDPTVSIDVRKGLAPVRAAWIEARGDGVVVVLHVEAVAQGQGQVVQQEQFILDKGRRVIALPELHPSHRHSQAMAQRGPPRWFYP